MTRKWQHYKNVHEETWLYSNTATEQDTYISLQYDHHFHDAPWCVSWCVGEQWLCEHFDTKSGAMGRVRELKNTL